MQHKLQTTFKNSIYKENNNFTKYILNFGDISKQERLEIYRNSAFVGLKETLLNTFPAVAKIVDVKFFRYLTHEYIKAYPPKDGCLSFYGENFPEFIKNFSELEKHEYLHDLAKLEWFFSKSYDAKEVKTLNALDFEKLIQTNADKLLLKINPSVFYIKSYYPIFSLWKLANNEGDGENIDISKPENIVIYRTNDDLQVYIKPLTEEEIELLDLINKGKYLNEALEIVLEKNNAFNPQPLLEVAIKYNFFMQ